MQLGIVPAEGPSHGGMWQYTLSLVRAVATLKVGEEARVLPRHVDQPWVERVRAEGLKIQGEALGSHGRSQVGDLIGKIPSPLLDSMMHLKVRFAWQGPLAQRKLRSTRQRPELRDHLQRLGIEALLFAAPDPLAAESGIASIMAVHDLQHRLQPQFKEVSGGGQWQLREYIYRNAARKCLYLMVDSEVGKEDLLNFYEPYGARQEQVRILPFVPAPYMRTDVSQQDVADVRRRHALPPRYLFYPAHFWPHKNHARLVRALALANSTREAERIQLVFCGSASGKLRRKTLKELHDLVRVHRLKDEVHFLGYVADDDMAALYRGATALVMPTFFGPTNIPVIEAWNLECPVITSRIRGITEQVRDAGMLVDPSSEEEIAAALITIWEDESLGDRLVLAGKSRLASYTPEDFAARLAGILADAEELLGQ